MLRRNKWKVLAFILTAILFFRLGSAKLIYGTVLRSEKAEIMPFLPEEGLVGMTLRFSQRLPEGQVAITATYASSWQVPIHGPGIMKIASPMV